MSILRSRVGTMALKIDLEKAYDCLEWLLIRHTLQFFHFPPSWIDFIMSCISSSSLEILVNSERLEDFSPSRGIRQGDPLSLYIFILCIEYLAYLIRDEADKGNWMGSKLREMAHPSLIYFLLMMSFFLPRQLRKISLLLIKFWMHFVVLRTRKLT